VTTNPHLPAIRRATALASGVLLLLAGALATEAAAQTTRPAPQETAPESRNPMATIGATGPLVDLPVDRRVYRIGPGDVLGVAILGEYNEVFQLAVSPEGSLLVPGMGIVDLQGATLEEAEGRVRRMVERLYRNVEVRLALAQVRTFKVFLVGDVEDPGVRTATAATRASELVGHRDDDGVRRRALVLRRADGSTVPVDLVRFAQTGDVGANPILREGDAIVVPSIDRIVTVTGQVRFPGRYEYLPGETLRELLHVANGGAGFPADAADTLRLVRVGETGARTFENISRAEAADPGAGGHIVLRPFDGIYLPAVTNFREQRVAEVRGQVRNPGVYPIRPDTTTVRELIRMAGGFTPEASLTHATLRRTTATHSASGAPTEELERLPPELLTATERQILQIQTQGDAARTVVVDFRRLFAEGGDAYDQTLRGGDRLDVPERRDEITVLGAVVDPGIVRHVPGLTVPQSVQLAGGYSRRANPGQITVLRGHLGTRAHVRDVQQLEAGDTVIVPYREDTDWLRRLQASNAVVQTVAGMVIGTIALINLLN
jgi:protein involved in polysaccharide export with SLBB domain